MHAQILASLTLLSTALALPATAISRQANACFIIGNEVLPGEVADVATAIQPDITCSNTATTLSNVPDVTSGGVTFSDIDFSTSNLSPLAFALETFATANPLANTDLQFFQDSMFQPRPKSDGCVWLTMTGLNTYLATEVGIRSVGGNLAIKVPKFFLQFQVSRIQTAQGNPPAAAGQQVDHLLGKVTKNAAGENAALLAQVTALADILA